MICHLILPSLKITGGTKEALRFGTLLRTRNISLLVTCMWRTQIPLDVTNYPTYELSSRFLSFRRAILELPLQMFRFHRKLKEDSRVSLIQDDTIFIFTHYITLPLALLVPANKRFVFVQDIEWCFIKNKFISEVLRKIILLIYKRCKLISANSYLTSKLKEENIDVAFELKIWANSSFFSEKSLSRDIDFVMVLRHGSHKRLDLYYDFIEKASKEEGLRICIISPEDYIGQKVRDRVAICLIRPSLAEMRDIYARSKCFVLLSEHEGFGLPPLEAMGSGCVPVCRDSGGVRAYMVGDLQKLLVPLESDPNLVFRIAAELISQPDKLESLATAARQIFNAGQSSIEVDAGALERALILHR